MALTISFTQIEKITAGDPQVMKQLLEIFVRENTLALAKIEECLAGGNWSELKKTAHKLKSSLALIGLSDARALAEELEQDAGTDLQQTKKIVLEIKTICLTVVEEINKKIKALT